MVDFLDFLIKSERWRRKKTKTKMQEKWGLSTLLNISHKFILQKDIKYNKVFNVSLNYDATNTN
jgi:hypothetical protein